MKSKRNELEEQLELLKLSSACPLRKSREERLRILRPEMINSPSKPLKSRIATRKRWNLRNLPAKVRVVQRSKKQQLAKPPSKRFKRVRAECEQFLNSNFNDLDTLEGSISILCLALR